MMLSASLHMASCPVVAEACTNQIVEFQGNGNSQEYNCRVFRKNSLIFFEHCSRLSANWYLIKNQLLSEKVAVLRERIFMSQGKRLHRARKWTVFPVTIVYYLTRSINNNK